MKERPMLMSAPMVRAILAGTKTQTRRTVKPQPRIMAGELYAWKDNAITVGELLQCCPYGKPGDRLWVREAWGAHFIWDDVPPSEIPNDWKACIFYMADGFSTGGCSQTQRDKWRPSIHMPRWASRILLEIVSVRVERLQDISEADAIAEGADPYRLPVHPAREKLRHVDGFSALWESINGAGSWGANPFVWCVEFKRVTQ